MFPYQADARAIVLSIEQIGRLLVLFPPPAPTPMAPTTRILQQVVAILRLLLPLPVTILAAGVQSRRHTGRRLLRNELMRRIEVIELSVWIFPVEIEEKFLLVLPIELPQRFAVDRRHDIAKHHF